MIKEIYDVVTKKAVRLIPNEWSKAARELCIPYSTLSDLVFARKIAHNRFIKSEDKYLIFTLIDLDTQEEFDCVTPATLFIYLNLPPTKQSVNRIYALRAKRQNLVNIYNRTFYVKGTNPKTATTPLKSPSPLIAALKQKKKEQKKIETLIRQRFKTILKLKGLKPCHKTRELVGCSPIEFRNYLENKFKPGMSWENYGRRGWVIDHIIPVSLFDLTDLGQQKKCFHYTNLQPLWDWENGKKYNKIIDNTLVEIL